MALRNEYEISDDVTKIYIDRRNGERIDILVDTDFFKNRLIDLDAKIYITTSASGLSYASILLRTEFAKFRKMLLHRFILDAPEGKLVDHINRITHDNRTANLRLVDNSANMQNRNLQANNTTGVRGVTLRPSGKYCARVRRERKVVYYEQFDTIQEAAAAVRRKRAELLPFSGEEGC